MPYYHEYQPIEILRPFLECIWILHPINRHCTREVIIPGGRAEILFILHDRIDWFSSSHATEGNSHHGATLLGPRNKSFYIQQHTALIIGARFKHGGLTPFSRLPMSNLLNQVISLDNIFGNKTQEWTSRLEEATHDELKVNILQTILSQSLFISPQDQEAGKLIALVKQHDSTSIQNICQYTGIHYKKLERTFSHYTGYNPKSFIRIVRFYNALRNMKYSAELLTTIGLDHGYYDQAHFIKDFKEFTGSSPSKFEFETSFIANLLLKSRYV
jgi:AraC-like DNA-binding protein